MVRSDASSGTSHEEPHDGEHCRRGRAEVLDDAHLDAVMVAKKHQTSGTSRA